MGQKKTLLSVWGRISRLFSLRGRSVSIHEATRLYYPSPKSEDDLNSFPYLPDSGEIQVVEIDQVEFVREWRRTVAEEASALAAGNPESAPGFDRRLPNFDRRRPDYDRRAGDTHERRGRTPQGGPLIRPKK
jgi:hypothetical protein